MGLIEELESLKNRVSHDKFIKDESFRDGALYGLDLAIKAEKQHQKEWKIEEVNFER